MIFNTEYFLKSNLTDEEFVTMLIIKNKNYENLSPRERWLDALEHKELISKTKGKVGEPSYLKQRLTKKGKDFLRDVSIPGVSDDAKNVMTNACASYESRGYGDKIGNKKKAVSLISWYLVETGYSAEQVQKAISEYVWSVGEVMYCSVLSNLIWKPTNVFETKPNTADSKLYKLMSQK